MAHETALVDTSVPSRPPANLEALCPSANPRTSIRSAERFCTVCSHDTPASCHLRMTQPLTIWGWAARQDSKRWVGLHGTETHYFANRRCGAPRETGQNGFRDRDTPRIVESPNFQPTRESSATIESTSGSAAVRILCGFSRTRANSSRDAQPGEARPRRSTQIRGKQKP